MSKQLCNIDYCVDFVYAKGLCRKHYCLKKLNGVPSYKKRNEENAILHFIEDNKNEELDDNIFKKELNKTVRLSIQELSPRMEKILRMRFGIGEDRSYTLDEIASDLEVSRERIRKLESIAIERLKHPSIKNKLYEYMRI